MAVLLGAVGIALGGAGLVTAIMRTRPGVASVKDPAPARGGADAETAEKGEAREPASLKGRDR